MSCLAPPLRSGAKQLGASRLRPERSWYNSSQLGASANAPDTNLAFASSGTASHGAVLGVELEQSLQRGSCIQKSQRIGSAANPADRADGNRKQRGSRALIGINVEQISRAKDDRF